jgi:integrase/recombinase XerD
MRKDNRKSIRVSATKKVAENLTIKEMFERVIWFKQSEGLVPRTLEEYHLHFTKLFGARFAIEEIHEI